MNQEYKNNKSTKLAHKILYGIIFATFSYLMTFLPSFLQRSYTSAAPIFPTVNADTPHDSSHEGLDGTCDSSPDPGFSCGTYN